MDKIPSDNSRNQLTDVLLECLGLSFFVMMIVGAIIENHQNQSTNRETITGEVTAAKSFSYGQSGDEIFAMIRERRNGLEKIYRIDSGFYSELLNTENRCFEMKVYGKPKSRYVESAKQIDCKK
jgi:hypothetical protein